MHCFDTERLAVKNAEMFIDGYKVKPVNDTSYKGFVRCLLR